MKKSKFTESQIIGILRDQDRGLKVSDICREHGISPATFHIWKAKYGGMDVGKLKRMKELEAENSRLKRMFADLSLVHGALKDAVEKSSKPCEKTRAC
jgi:putative transposase